MSSIVAISSATSALSLPRLPALRDMAASDASAVGAIDRVAEVRTRRPTVDETADSTESRRRPIGEAPDRSKESGTSTSSARVPVDTAATTGTAEQAAAGKSGYVAQTIAQERIGAGLHIEPWRDAITAYRRAEAGPAGGSLVQSVVV